VPAALIGLLAALGLGGCTGVAVAEAPASGAGRYQVWGLNEASSTLTGGDRQVVLNGDQQHDNRAFFTVSGTWGEAGLTLDEASTGQVRALAGRLPERTGDPRCTRLVLVDEGMVTDRAVAVVNPDQPGVAGGPLVATRLR
jgi:hypothetical protein